MALEKDHAAIDDGLWGSYRTSGAYTKGENFVLVDNEAYAMEIEDEVVHVRSNTAVVTITLPSVKKAKGKIYTIWGFDADDNNVTVQDLGDDAAKADLVMAAANNFGVYYSDGYRWYLLTYLIT